MRFIRKNTESFLSYTENDQIGVVIFFNHQKSIEELNKTKSWGCKLINKAIDLGEHIIYQFSCMLANI